MYPLNTKKHTLAVHVCLNICRITAFNLKKITKPKISISLHVHKIQFTDVLNRGEKCNSCKKLKPDDF